MSASYMGGAPKFLIRRRNRDHEHGHIVEAPAGDAATCQHCIRVGVGSVTMTIESGTNTCA